MRVTAKDVRNFLLETLHAQNAVPTGPPTHEVILPLRDEEAITSRVIKAALRRVEDIVQESAESEVSRTFPRTLALPYVASRDPTPREWVDHLYDESEGAFTVFGSALRTWESLASCGWLQPVAGVPRDRATASSSSHVRCEAAAVPVGGVWECGAPEYVVGSNSSSSASESEDSNPTAAAGLNSTAAPAVGACSVLFAYQDPPEGRMEDVQLMRTPKYMQHSGFTWGTGTGAGSAGRKVRNRFHHMNLWRDTPALPTIRELCCYVQPRFPHLMATLREQPFECSSLGPQQGTWCRMLVCEDFPDEYVTGWHGSNLYFCNSIIKSRKLIGTKGSRGHVGIWSHKLSTRSKCGSYMYYILSGTGVAWGVMFEIKVDPKYTRNSGANMDQWCTQEGFVVIHAVWFHGIPQEDFSPCMYIWPEWDPKLEC